MLLFLWPCSWKGFRRREDEGWILETRFFRFSTRPPCRPAKCGWRTSLVDNDRRIYSSSPRLQNAFIVHAYREKENERTIICANVLEEYKIRWSVAWLSLWISFNHEKLQGGKCLSARLKMLHISLCPQWEIDMNAAASRYSYCISQERGVLSPMYEEDITHISVIWEGENGEHC